MRRSYTCVLLSLSILSGSDAQVQFTGSNYYESFNVLLSSGTITLEGTAASGHQVAIPNVAGWQVAKIAGSGTSDMTLIANHGTQTGGRVYSYGASLAQERALGLLGSGTNVAAAGVAFINGTDKTISAVRISYSHEIWTVQGSTGTIASEDRLAFSYGLSDDGISINNFLTHSGLKPFAALDAYSSSSRAVLNVADGTNPSRAREGNSSEWKNEVTATISGLSWAPGAILFLRWEDSDTGGFDAGHGIDDFNLSSVETGPGVVGQPVVGVRIDGDFTDWNKGSLLFQDTLGDGRSNGIDFDVVGASMGADGLSLYIQSVDPFVIGSSQLRISLDTDGDGETGSPYIGLGIDVTLDFSLPQTDLRFYPAQALYTGGGTVPAHEFIAEILPMGLNSAGTHPAGNRHEILIPLSALPNVKPGGRMGILFRDGIGDFAPNAGTVFYADVPPGLEAGEPVIELEKLDSSDIRIAAWNVLFDGPMEDGKEERYGRQLAATRPDIINFQEMWQASAAWARDFVERWIPSGDGGQWYAAKNNDCITVSRFPIQRSWPIDGNLVVWIDTADTLGMDTVIVNAHTPAHVENQAPRMVETDNFMLLVRRLIMKQEPFGPQDEFTLFIVGDLNANSPKLELTAARTGKFSSTAFRSLNFWPDSYDLPLVDAAPRHTHRQRLFTWKSQTSSNTQRLDYIYYQESRLTKKRSYVVDTVSMPQDFRETYGLNSTDSDASDHLLVISDFRRRELSYAWETADRAGEGWFYSEWMGWVYPFGSSFYYSENHGNVFVINGEWGNWIWDEQLSWWYTHSAYYPFAFLADEGTWIYFSTTDEAGRTHYDYDLGDWVH